MQVCTPNSPAVILAAGEGSRIQPGNGRIPKPLTELLGMTLLERAVLSCRRAGVGECYVVVGYQKKQIIPHIRELGIRYSIPIIAVENQDWEEGNGTSVLAASRHLSGEFLLVMCDHLFDPDIAFSLMEAKNGHAHCLLAVDGRTDQIFDLADATKVCVNGGRVTAIGKEISSFNAIDTGLFLCQPTLFDALEVSRMGGDGSLSGAVRQLVGKGEMQAVDIGDCFWMDVDTPESLAHATYLLEDSPLNNQPAMPQLWPAK